MDSTITLYSCIELYIMSMSCHGDDVTRNVYELWKNK